MIRPLKVLSTFSRLNDWNAYAVKKSRWLRRRLEV